MRNQIRYCLGNGRVSGNGRHGSTTKRFAIVLGRIEAVGLDDDRNGNCLEKDRITTTRMVR